MKFLVFISIVVALWYVMRWIQQAGARHLSDPASRGGANRRRRMRATDTVICARCGAYVPTEFPTACARPDCPFPGVG
jgi:hypothetical protein